MQVRKLKKSFKRKPGLKVVFKDMVLDADMVLVAVGVAPNSEIAVEAGILLGPGNAVTVGKNLLTSDPHVYAAGDCADAVSCCDR